LRRRVIILFFLLLCVPAALAQQQLTTIEVNYANPEQIKAAIQPLLSEGSSVGLYENRLILNVTPEELVKIRGLLKQLDSAGQQLLVTLRSDGAGSDTRSGVNVEGSVKAGDTTITTRSGGHVTETRTTVRVNDYHGTNSDNGSQAVRVTEGMPAYISTGMTAPVQSYTTGPDGRRYYQQGYVDAVSGFYATTWVNDGVVRISIDQSNNQLKGETISTQQLQSQVSGGLGQWIPIGVISDTASQRTQDIASREQMHRANSTQLFIKVELLQ
jgi:hypothetical protein